MKNRIKRNGVCIKACVLTWIVLPVLLLFVSISPTEASNSTTIQEAWIGQGQKTLTDTEIQMLNDIQINSDISPEQKVLIDSEIHVLKNPGMDSEHKANSEDSVASQDNNRINLDNKINLDPKSEDNKGAEKSESGSSNLAAKTSENSNKEIPGSEGVNQEINTGADTNADKPKSTITNPGQKTTVKSDTVATESPGPCLKQKTGADTSKETECSVNKGETAEPKTSGAAYAINNALSGGDQKKQSSCATTTPQKTDTNPDSNTMNSGSDSSSINSGPDSSSTNSGQFSSSTDSGSGSSSTDSGSSSSSSAYGSAHIIKNTAPSTQSIEKPKPTVNAAEAIGIKDLQPKIEGQIVQASVINPPSKLGSFLVGFGGALLFVFMIIRRRN